MNAIACGRLGAWCCALAVACGLAAACGGGGGDGRGVDATAAGGPVDVLWVGAHPDDELYLAPALGTFCVDQAQCCGFLVMTQGELSTCKRPALCSDDLEGVHGDELGGLGGAVRRVARAWDCYLRATSDLDLAIHVDEPLI